MWIKRNSFAYNKMMLKTKIPKLYKVKEGQTLLMIAEAFSLPPIFLARCNDLQREVIFGQVIKIPESQGNLYTVQAGDTKELLCGSEENYLRKNKTEILYPGQKVFL